MNTTTKVALGAAALLALYYATKKKDEIVVVTPPNGITPPIMVPLPPSYMNPKVTSALDASNLATHGSQFTIDAIGRKKYVNVSAHKRGWPNIGASWFCQANPTAPGCNPTLSSMQPAYTLRRRLPNNIGASWFCQANPTAPGCNPTLRSMQPVHTVILPMLKTGRVAGVKNTYDLQRSLAI